MPGVPMVATSPMRHDLSAAAISPNGQPIHPVDVHAYEPPWKALCDFALHSDLDRPGYTHLVNEVSAFFKTSQTPSESRCSMGHPASFHLIGVQYFLYRFFFLLLEFDAARASAFCQDLANRLDSGLN